MSTQVFPTLAGLGWSVKRTPLWKTRKQESISGKRTTLADWSFPRWQWELTFDFLRQAGANQQVTSFAGSTYSEFASLAGFFNARQGGFDSFLYTDPDDNTSPTDQPIGTGDGTTTTFQLVRAFGGFVEPILAPSAITNVKVNGVVKTLGTDYAVSTWGGSSTPGVITFTAAPAASAAITATFTFNFPCQFDDDSLTFEKFMAALYQAKSVKFSSLK
ncbi:MAG TPA: DUF2460 domain-containing protein [Roseiarcus sp.]|nr:DUF2460 domain-containing protein [Roseiarcus sp.]